MIAIIDYDAGNIKSVEKALQYIGAQCVITRDTDLIGRADKVIVPGVGAFEQAMDNMRQYQLIDVLREVAKRGTPILGICLGLQLFFERSEESEHNVSGLALLPGEIIRFPDKDGYKIPHMGWNSLHIQPSSRLLQGVPENAFVYFVHSYAAVDCGHDVTATAGYGAPLTASVERGNVYGVQYHPEKSGETGLRILKAFCE